METPESTDDISRGRVLASVRSALLHQEEVHGLGTSGVAVPGAPGTPRSYRDAENFGEIRLLEEVLLDYKASVTHAVGSLLARHIADLVGAQGLRTIVVPAGIDKSWIDKIEGIDVKFDAGNMTHAELSTIDGVITGSTVAIAETGTLVLTCQEDEGRRAITLLPDFHFCIVRSKSVVRSVTEAFRKITVDNPVTFISGPSATSDIELRRVEGVHGPRNLFVVIVE